jgi:hypothetical protein
MKVQDNPRDFSHRSAEFKAPSSRSVGRPASSRASLLGAARRSLWPAVRRSADRSAWPFTGTLRMGGRLRALPLLAAGFAVVSLLGVRVDKCAGPK